MLAGADLLSDPRWVVVACAGAAPRADASTKLVHNFVCTNVGRYLSKRTAGSHPAAVKINTRPLTLGTFTLKLYLRASAAAIKTVFPMACRGPITHVAKTW